MNPLIDPRICPGNIDQLQELLAELLDDEIGTVKGTTKKAILTALPMEEPPSVVGIRCLIDRTPAILSSQPIGSHGRSATMAWNLTLTQFDRSNKGMQRWDKAIEKLRSRFPVGKDVVKDYSEASFPQVRFTLVFENVFVRDGI